MTFTHEGNKTFSEGHLVNFEKMHMLAQTMRSIRNCRSRHLGKRHGHCEAVEQSLRPRL